MWQKCFNLNVYIDCDDNQIHLQQADTAMVRDDWLELVNFVIVSKRRNITETGILHTIKRKAQVILSVYYTVRLNNNYIIMATLKLSRF